MTCHWPPSRATKRLSSHRLTSLVGQTVPVAAAAHDHVLVISWVRKSALVLNPAASAASLKRDSCPANHAAVTRLEP